MNYVLIGTLLLLVIGFVIGLYKGLFGLLGGLLTWVIIIGFLYVATPSIEAGYMNGAVYQKFYNSVSSQVNRGLVNWENKSIEQINEEREKASENGYISEDGTEEAADTRKKAALDLSDSESLRDYLSKAGIDLPKNATDFISKAVDDSTNAAAEIAANITDQNESRLTSANQTITDTVSAQIATLMVKGLAILTSLLVAFIITRVIALIAQFIGNLPVVGGVTRLLGGIWGVIVALFIIWLFMDVVTCFSITKAGMNIMNQIESSELLNTLYIDNPLEFIISK